MSQNYVLKNVSKLWPGKYVSENILNDEKCPDKMSRQGQKFWPGKRAKISGQSFWPEIKFCPADESFEVIFCNFFNGDGKTKIWANFSRFWMSIGICDKDEKVDTERISGINVKIWV